MVWGTRGKSSLCDCLYIQQSHISLPTPWFPLTPPFPIPLHLIPSIPPSPLPSFLHLLFSFAHCHFLFYPFILLLSHPPILNPPPPSLLIPAFPSIIISLLSHLGGTNCATHLLPQLFQKLRSDDPAPFCKATQLENNKKNSHKEGGYEEGIKKKKFNSVTKLHES